MKFPIKTSVQWVYNIFIFQLWRSHDGSHILTADDHNDVIRCVEFSNDSTMFATGSDDGSVNVCSKSSIIGNLIWSHNEATGDVYVL